MYVPYAPAAAGVSTHGARRRFGAITSHLDRWALEGRVGSAAAANADESTELAARANAEYRGLSAASPRVCNPTNAASATMQAERVTSAYFMRARGGAKARQGRKSAVL